MSDIKRLYYHPNGMTAKVYTGRTTVIVLLLLPLINILLAKLGLPALTEAVAGELWGYIVAAYLLIATALPTIISYFKRPDGVDIIAIEPLPRAPRRLRKRKE